MLICCYSRLFLFLAECTPHPHAPFQEEQPIRGSDTSPSRARKTPQWEVFDMHANFLDHPGVDSHALGAPS
jgi:hypothetical protein